MTGRLIRDIILPRLDRGELAALPDSVVLPHFDGRIAYTTDSFTVSPILLSRRQYRLACDSRNLQRPLLLRRPTALSLSGTYPRGGAAHGGP